AFLNIGDDYLGLRAPASLLLMLNNAALDADVLSCIQEDFYVSIREDSGADVASFHNHAAAQSQSALLCHHPVTHLRINGDARSSLSYVALANAQRDVAAIKQHAIAFRSRLKFDARFRGQARECPR